MKQRRVHLILVVVAVFALLVAACSSASDKAAEELAERLIEAGADGDVDIDVSGDGEDATINVETEEGSLSIGTGSDLPDALTIPVPDGGNVTVSGTQGTAVFASLTYEQGRFDEITEFYEQWTAGSGDEWAVQTMTVDAGEETQRTTLWIDTENGSSITVSDCFDIDDDGSSGRFNAACVTINQG